MADGEGVRWNNYKNTPKQLIRVEGETLLERTVRLLKKHDNNCDIIITSHNPMFEVEGALRYEPKNNKFEIDRFTEELIEDNICFLYGDTYYTEDAISKIIYLDVTDLLFFGTQKSIVAIKIKNSKIFKYHVERVRKLFCDGIIKQCKGWQVYRSFSNISFENEMVLDNFIFVGDETKDFNKPSDYHMHQACD